MKSIGSDYRKQSVSLRYKAGSLLLTKNAVGMLIPLLGLAGLGACTTTGMTDRVHTVCHTAAAATLVGKAAPDDAAILRTTGSSIVRRNAPGDATTKDFREERVTVTIAEGRVMAASCGEACPVAEDT